MGSSVGGPRNHFYRTREQIRTGSLRTRLAPRFRQGQADHRRNIADQLDFESIAARDRRQHNTVDQFAHSVQLRLAIGAGLEGFLEAFHLINYGRPALRWGAGAAASASAPSVWLPVRCAELPEHPAALAAQLLGSLRPAH